MACTSFKEYAKSYPAIAKDAAFEDSLSEESIKSVISDYIELSNGNPLELDEALNAISEIIQENFDEPADLENLKVIINSVINPNRSSNTEDDIRFINLDSYTLKNTESLDSVLSTESDIIRFRNFARSNLIRYTNLNIYNGLEVNNIVSLNSNDIKYLLLDSIV